MALAAKHDAAEVVDMLPWAQRAIDAAGGDPTKGDLIVGSPLAATFAMRSNARWCVGDEVWKADFRAALDMARAFDPTTRAGAAYYTYGSSWFRAFYSGSQTVYMVAQNPYT